MRLFVALEIPADVREALGELIGELRPLCQGAHWARPQGMHVTLKFIGHAIEGPESEKWASLRAALAAIQSSEPLALQFRGIGFFPQARRPRVVWCGIQASANLARLAGDLDRALARLGIPAEQRDFTPHLTLARFRSPAGTEALVRACEQVASRDFGSVRATQFHLLESILKASGAEYKRLETYTFVKERA